MEERDVKLHPTTLLQRTGVMSSTGILQSHSKDPHLITTHVGFKSRCPKLYDLVY
jgi:hypothetical protein